jgi:alkaline phosphatase D
MMRQKPLSGWVLLAVQAIGLAASLARADGPAAEATLSRIAFGSCAKQDQPQPIWDAVVAARPQLFILLGDNIYADTDDMTVLRAKYQVLANQPGFKLLKQTCPLLATWDDHDYGANDAGGEYPKKAESQQVFLDFFGAPASDPRRTRPGVYNAQTFGPPGRRVQVILLDLRYFRSPLKHGFSAGEPGEGLEGPYGPNLDAGATILGRAQWKWLDEQLRQPADLRLIGSSVQVISHEHGYESWANFPAERERLLRLIRDTHAKGVVFLSGDRHEADISRLPASDPPGVGYPLFDITSSSLNQKSGTYTKAKVEFRNEINSYRVGSIYLEENFGLIDIDWNQSDPLVRLQVRDVQGNVVLQQRVTLGQLDAKDAAGPTSQR